MCVSGNASKNHGDDDVNSNGNYAANIAPYTNCMNLIYPVFT